MTTEPRAYTTIEVARRLGVSLPTVQRWVDAGHLKAWKTPGGHRRIDATSAEALIRAHRLGTGLPEPVAPPVAAESSGAAPTVLLVDDDPIARELLEHLVSETVPGARLQVASNGFEALLAIGQAAPDVVVTDLQMPHMDGAEMIRHLVERGLVRPQAVLVVTGHDAAALERMEALTSGVTLLRKPLQREAFAAALRQALAAASEPLPI